MRHFSVSHIHTHKTIKISGETMWDSMTNWFTPTVLFCVLNLVIGTIYFTSSNYTAKRNENHEHAGTSAPLLFRAPSSSTLLERVKSINFCFQCRRSSPDQAPEPLFPQDDDDDVSRENREGEEARELHSGSHEHMTRRCQSETSVSVPKTTTTTTTAANVVVKRKALKKSASEKIVKLEEEKGEEEERETRRPATMSGKTKTASNQVADEAVDEKADDFINRFRQQLKLQRIDSILRYKEMLNRGR